MTVTPILLHPHPDMGGDQHNHVVVALFRALDGAVRFDFPSSDMDACVAATEAHVDGPVVLVGYSFGAMVASRVHDERVAGWFLVAPPIDHVDAEALAADPRPKVLAVPERDFSPPAKVLEVTATWASTEVRTIPGADHFLAGATAQLAADVAAWIDGL